MRTSEHVRRRGEDCAKITKSVALRNSLLSLATTSVLQYGGRRGLKNRYGFGWKSMLSLSLLSLSRARALALPPNRKRHERSHSWSLAFYFTQFSLILPWLQNPSPLILSTKPIYSCRIFSPSLKRFLKIIIAYRAYTWRDARACVDCIETEKIKCLKRFDDHPNEQRHLGYLQINPTQLQWGTEVFHVLIGKGVIRH